MTPGARTTSTKVFLRSLTAIAESAVSNGDKSSFEVLEYTKVHGKDDVDVVIVPWKRGGLHDISSGSYLTKYVQVP